MVTRSVKSLTDNSVGIVGLYVKKNENAEKGSQSKLIIIGLSDINDFQVTFFRSY